MNIPFHKPHITEDEINEVVDSLRSGWLTMGSKTVRFENEFAAYIGTKYAVAVSFCTACFYATKPLSTGEGRMITTWNDELGRADKDPPYCMEFRKTHGRGIQGKVRGIMM
jgi:dTDP-4-amino-4,6-dideoxygalactose transaminase